MTFDEWIANDEGVKRFGLELRTEWVDAAREGWEAATRVSDTIQRLEDENEALQAKIDALMLEHCHDEMTGEQKQRWAAHQRPAMPKEQKE